MKSFTVPPVAELYGETDADVVDAVPAPAPLTAATVNEYVVAPEKPVEIVHAKPTGVQERPAGLEATV
jgi:hypothetical protein